ncbi:MAG: restriction endonuclease [Flavobacteriales bacterium]|nr:restriction endonuclease [Flavobacteriales bacterium]
MIEVTVHPNVYATGPSKGLIHLLEKVWVREHTLGSGTLHIVSGFANYNGGVRFYETFRHHIEGGGSVNAVFSGSTSARLTSRQVVEEMLRCGATVHVVNRKRLLHAKCYGVQDDDGDSLIVTSGNFTGPGMSQNVEMSALLDKPSTASANFSWGAMMGGLLGQQWEYYKPTLADLTAPGWSLLYDETAPAIVLDDTEEVTMVLRLGHSDTARINAPAGTNAARGTQYFWLSKDCYGFFPPLTIRNQEGEKATYSCLVTMRYIDLDIVDSQCRVTFEAENNLDFRLGTGRLRGTEVAREGDLALVTRVAEAVYELRIAREGSTLYDRFSPYATTYIGNRGKRYGYIANNEFRRLLT